MDFNPSDQARLNSTSEGYTLDDCYDDDDYINVDDDDQNDDDDDDK